MDTALPWQAASPAAPSAASTAAGGDTTPVVVATIYGPLVAEMALESLRDAGIPAMLRRNPAGAMYGMASGMWAEVPLLVPAALAPAAREVLAGMGLLPEDAA